jgi:hypothetical protein
MAASAHAQVPRTVLAEKKEEAAKDKEAKAGGKGKGEAAVEKTYVPLTHVDTEKVQAEWSHGAPHPKALVHGEDHYVTVGHPYVPKVDIEQMAAYRKEHQKQQQLVNKASAPTLPGGHVAHEHDQNQQLVGGVNKASAPTLPGGVAVPGGHVVWMPLHALSGKAAASADVRAQKKSSSPQLSASSHIVLPSEYSKIVEYGPGGQPIATIYGPPAGENVGMKLTDRGRDELPVQALSNDDSDSDSAESDPNEGLFRPIQSTPASYLSSIKTFHVTLYSRAYHV